MNRSRVLAFAGMLALGACSGGAPEASAPASQTLLPAAVPATASAVIRRRKLGRLTFHIAIPRKHRRDGHRGPSFIPPSTESVSIVLTTVNGGPPPAGLTTKATTNISSATCATGCTVNGPLSPPGSDDFTVDIWDTAGGTGHILAKASKTFTIAAGTANQGSITLLGVPSTFTIAGVPAGTAGTSVAPTTLTITALDHAGDTVVGGYANAITFGDSDATSASGLLLNSGSQSSSVQISSSTDVVQFAYSGLAIVPATLTAHATDATDATATFAPSASAPTSVCNGGGVTDTSECAAGPQINLYAPTGTGSAASFTTSQTGWTGSFLQTFAEGDTCSSLATISTSDNLTFTATALPAAAAGSCVVTLTGGATLTEAVTVTFTTSSVGISARHRKPMRP